MSLKNVKALLFDTFGTVADWRGSITRKGEALARMKSLPETDWDAFARAWRAGYKPGMARVQSGERPWTAIDTIHRERLDEILTQFDLDDAIGETDRQAMNIWWHQLDPWPDCLPGLRRLKTGYLLGTLSNGSIIGLASMAKRAGLPWDFVFSSDVFKAYKRDAAVYLGAIELLGVDPGETMMVAAHNDDLAAARSHGMRTAYIGRPYEYGPDQTVDFEPDQDWDVIGHSMEDLAEAMDV